MTIQINSDNKILITADNKIAAHEDCCCGEEEDCPDDIYIEANCNATYTITITGFTGDCACINGTRDVTWEAGDPHEWFGSVFGVYTLELWCAAGKWKIGIIADDGGSCHMAPASATGEAAYAESCPIGTYDLVGNTLGTDCRGQSGTAVVA